MKGSHKGGVHVKVEVVRPLLVFHTGINPNSSAEYPEFVKNISDACERLKLTNTRPFGETAMYMLGTMPWLWKGVIGQHGDAGVNHYGGCCYTCNVTTHCAS